MNDSPEAVTFSWSLSTTAVAINEVKDIKPTALVELDSTIVPAKFMTAVEALLYGTEEAEGYLPLPDEIIKLYNTTMADGG